MGGGGVGSQIESEIAHEVDGGGQVTQLNFFGLLLGIAISFDLYGVTNWSNVTVAFV